MLGYDYDYDDYDEHCRHCGHGMYFDVGMGPFNCPACGNPLAEPSPPPQPHPDDDVLLDPDFIFFDEVKAFRLLKQLGRLGECLES